MGLQVYTWGGLLSIHSLLREEGMIRMVLINIWDRETLVGPGVLAVNATYSSQNPQWSSNHRVHGEHIRNLRGLIIRKEEKSVPDLLI